MTRFQLLLVTLFTMAFSISLHSTERTCTSGINYILSQQVNRATTASLPANQLLDAYQFTPPTINDLGDRTFCATENNCNAEVILNFEIFGNCGFGELEITSVEADLDAIDTNANGVIESDEFVADIDLSELVIITPNNEFFIDTALYTIGTHAVRITVTDGCDNTVIHLSTFVVNDCSVTIPACIFGTTVTLEAMPEGDCTATLLATELLLNSGEDCSGSLQYAVYRSTEVIAAGEGFVPNPANNSITLTTFDNETTLLYIYAIDALGNFDYCQSFVLVQEDCHIDHIPYIVGVIATDDDETVAGVEVSLYGEAVGAYITNSDGSFVFYDLWGGGDFSVIPFKDTDPLNGVSTFDIVLIARHILGLQPLDSPYKIIAADANNSGTVTTLDLILIRKLILGIDSRFEYNTSWRFVAADYVFPHPANPWFEVFPEVANFNNIAAGANYANFIAVKIGDVNNSAQPNASPMNSGRGESSFNFKPKT